MTDFGELKVPSLATESLLGFVASDWDPVPPGGVAFPSIHLDAHLAFRCTFGYEGDVTVTCRHDINNRCEPQPLNFFGCYAKRSCNICLPPLKIPLGYEQDKFGGFHCAPGYGGEVAIKCLSCTSRLELGGCKPHAPCLPPLADLCIYDVSTCWGLAAGDYCEVPVKKPWMGNTTIARCPAGNTDYATRVVFDGGKPAPAYCPDPYETIAGYTKESGEWRCDMSTHRGFAQLFCKTLDECMDEPQLRGCKPLIPCIPPKTPDKCHYDTSDCESVPPGESCNVTCRAPYIGQMGQSSCHPDNIRYNEPVRGQLPDCSELVCPHPEQLPAGYAKAADGHLICAEGYGGQVNISCPRLNLSSCALNISLRGCLPLMPCTAPKVDRCSTMADACDHLDAGQSCWAFCRKHFTLENQTVYPWIGGLGSRAVPCTTTPRKDCCGDGICSASEEKCTDVHCAVDCPEADCKSVWFGMVGHPGQGYCPAGLLRRSEASSLEICQELCFVENDCLFVSFRPEDANALSSCRRFNASQCNASNLVSRPRFTSYAKKAVYVKLQAGDGGCPAGTFHIETFAECEAAIQDLGIAVKSMNYRERDNMVKGCQVSELGPLNPRGWFNGKHGGVPYPANAPICRLGLISTMGDDGNSTRDVRVPAWYDYVRAAPYAVAMCPADNVAPLPPRWKQPPPECNLDCPAPKIVPRGYTWKGDEWMCSEGFYGTAAVNCTVGDDCVVSSELIGCDELVACAMPTTDPCLYDFETWNCTGLMPGEDCIVTCKPPYEGSNITAKCPSTNIDPMQVFTWSQPMCNLSCADPVPLPPGYAKVSGEWVCDSGYGGTALASCSIDTQCVDHLALSGCLPLVGCRMPDMDPCVVDFSDCHNIDQGGTCRVGCRYPYVGSLVTSWCPPGNTDPDTEIRRYVSPFETGARDPTIEPGCRCDGPAILPMGYARGGSGLYCISGYTGDASINCSVPGEPCLDEVQIGGCTKTVPCKVPDVDPCAVDISGCGSEVPPGSTCVVKCGGEYLGNSTTAVCALDNTDPQGLQIPEDWKCHCPDPDPLPRGYNRIDEDAVECKAGFIGEVEHTCKVAGANCSLQITMTGCKELVPCKALNSTCLYDASNCSGVMAGETCDIKCVEPYVGISTTGYCPLTNTELETELQYNWPVCNHSICPMPPFGSIGFSAGIDRWGCAPGYGGTAVESCPISEVDCTSTTELEGCKPLVGCIKPSADLCRFDTSSCDSLNPGEFCILRCQTNYVGTSTGGVCAASNTNPDRLIDWQRPRCTMVCPDPTPMPAGYIRNPVTNALQCDTGWFGSARSSCYDARINPSNRSEGCPIHTTLYGCFKLEPCAVPDLDPCIYDYSLTSNLYGSQRAPLSCKRPYVGSSAEAYCPRNNLDATRIYQFFYPDCRCPDPCPVPAGYKKTAAGYDNFVCDEGYTGTAELRCSHQRQCQQIPMLLGCQKLLPCAPLNLSSIRCDADASDCEDVPYGGSCTVRCRHPYVGKEVTAICPATNVDPLTQPQLQGNLTCEIEKCKDSDVIPEGYVKGSEGWYCDDGWAGTPEVYCSVGLESATDGNLGCGLTVHPTGCLPKQPCVAPASLDGCKYDTSECGITLPGVTCRLRCRGPYVGEIIQAVCPDDNTNETQEVLLPANLPLDCQCPDPRPENTPQGYVLTTEGKWECAPGYAGKALHRCERSDTCLEEPELLGCLPLVPCVPPPNVDYCMYNLSQCEGVQPGQSCDITCVLPYQQWLVQNASCRVNNTDATMPIDWDPEPCTLTWGDCRDTMILPEGYEKAHEGYRCAKGFTGTPEVHCGAWEGCDTTPKVTGCFPIQHCRGVTFTGEEHCMYNTSACPQHLEPGQSCELSCNPPYQATGSRGLAKCDEHNIVWAGDVEVTAPICSCVGPRVAPAGYIKNGSGWFCDTQQNYTGTPQIVCGQADTCLIEPWVQGCEREGPCSEPDLDPCMYDTSNCRGVLPGEQCVLACNSSGAYAGSATTAFCLSPGGASGLTWSLPFCQLVYCPDPVGTYYLENGYIRNSSVWFCAENWKGTASKSCTHDTTCEPQATLSGCSPVEAKSCTFPELDPCRYDLSDCQGVRPGRHCTVKCKLPYKGWPQTAVCPPQNTSLHFEARELLFTRPYCDRETCDDPVPLPEGYMRVGEEFKCTNGYSGIPIAFCNHTADCGAQVELRGCTNETAVQASLLGLEYSSDQGPYSLCKAEDMCDYPSKEHQIQGYELFVNGRWRCDAGYTGAAKAGCSPQRECTSVPTLAGCVPIQPCLPIIDDSCDIDTSACLSVLGGSSCEITCKSPYAGASTIGSCPARNINTSEVLRWTRPTCVLDAALCPAGFTAPDGYVKDSGKGWLCAPGFQGTASVKCTITDACETKCVSTGCEPIQICELPATDSCMLNMSYCERLLPTRTCTVSCIPPYVGTPVLGSCHHGGLGGPYGNVTLPAVFDWTPPDCTCPDPAVPVPGYQKVAGTWSCAPGFAGTAKKFCQEPDQCLDQPKLDGCLPLVSCRDPPRSTGLACEPLNVTNCTDVKPGESCQVTCAEPYVGTPSLATCYSENTNPARPLEMPVDPCSLGCADLVEIPRGYKRRNITGVGVVKSRNPRLEAWECDVADRYSGTADVHCELDATCRTSKVFEGCQPIIRPCLAPELDGCKYDVSDCHKVSPGGSCTIRCAGNYTGKPSVGVCPEGNRQDEGLQFRKPRCLNEDPSCPLPSSNPEGYSLDDLTEEFSCAAGSVGTEISTRCGHDEVCQNVIEPTGCVDTFPCAPPKVDVEFFMCERSNLDCWNVDSGASCELDCKLPFRGPPIVAKCPAGNTNSTRQLVLDWIPCDCPDPSSIPDGYVKDRFGYWQCAEGYTGTAVKQCRRGRGKDSICIALPELVGCEPSQPCARLVADKCEQNVSQCAMVQPSSRCTITCNEPWETEQSTVATCQDKNTDITRPLVWQAPVCRKRCAEPAVLPEGYGWWSHNYSAYCLEGFLGPATTTCTLNTTSCNMTTEVAGCHRLVPCIPPIYQKCAVNMTFCQNVMPGESCTANCSLPYVGFRDKVEGFVLAKASCPAGNIDPERMLDWDLPPNCSVPSCEDPAPLPDGYAFGVKPRRRGEVFNPEPQWYCDTGFIGLPERYCGTNKDCVASGFLRGCKPRVSCRAPKVDTCRYDASRCSNTRAGDICELRCRPPFAGRPTFPVCSGDNTDPDGLDYRLPNCVLDDEFDPIPMSTGYAVTFEGYECAVGFAGTLDIVCTMGAGCRTSNYPTGCAPPVPCEVGGFQDQDGRAGVISGSIVFGPAQLDPIANQGKGNSMVRQDLVFSGRGVVDESEVENYSVYFTDICNETFGVPIASVEKSQVNDTLRCCTDSVYNVNISSTDVPEGAFGLAVVVQIKSKRGIEKSSNYWMMPFVDQVDPVTAGTPRSTALSALIVCLMLWLLP
eukprot:TRINITY_DN13001_c0_g1_i1.p1 TRINITY_DN13001_c0_g1~~TRINITY_DN13001_c0_g1_i1.p1  ORF type:complete len:3592 (-),score=360.49 TRINITY_DN13001_c0_g1_i1:116-10366(-)